MGLMLAACTGKDRDTELKPTAAVTDEPTKAPTPTVAPTPTPEPTPTPTPDPTPTPVPTVRDGFEKTGYSGGYSMTVDNEDWNFIDMFTVGGKVIMLPLNFGAGDLVYSLDPTDRSTKSAVIGAGAYYPQMYKINEEMFAVSSQVYSEDSEGLAFGIYDKDLNQLYGFFMEDYSYLNPQFDPDGQTMWYVDQVENALAKYNYVTGETEYFLQKTKVGSGYIDPSSQAGYLFITTWDDRDGFAGMYIFDTRAQELVDSVIDNSVWFREKPDQTEFVVIDQGVGSNIALYKAPLKDYISLGTEEYGDPAAVMQIEDGQEIYQVKVDWVHRRVLTVLSTSNGQYGYMTCYCYDLDTGKCLAKYDVGSLGDGPRDVSTLDAEEGILYIMTSDCLKQEIELIAWDYMEDDADDTAQTFVKASYIPEEIEKTRQEFEEKHHFAMYLGSEVFASAFSYRLKMTSDWKAVSDTIDYLDEVLDIYPEGFFDQMKQGGTKTLAVYICAGFEKVYDYDIDTAIAVATSFGYERALAVDVNYLYSMKKTIVHEISHWIDKQIDYAENMGWTGSDVTFSEDWLTYQPEDFNYHYDYNNGTPVYKYIFSSDDLENAYFIDDYSQTYPGEDKARLFENLVYPDDYLFTSYMAAPHLREKLHVYFSWIRRAFDDSTWPEETIWEQKLREADEEYGGEGDDVNSQEAEPAA